MLSPKPSIWGPEQDNVTLSVEIRMSPYLPCVNDWASLSVDVKQIHQSYSQYRARSSRLFGSNSYLMDGERRTVLAHSVKYHYRSKATSTSFEFYGAKLLENIPNLINGGSCVNHIQRWQRTDAACRFQAFLHMPISMITIPYSYCHLRET